MIHYGDITKINGYDVPIVDCVVGGSPCQDLSVAGKRAGLDGERSGLFMEQIRVTKEMREYDERVNGRSGVDVRPRFFVWENVPGAFSSNKGQDFRIVLEEVAKVVDKDAVIPMPPKDKWTTSGAIVGDGWSIAWRVCDAQFYGVPQRRRRISLVADFGGQCAKEVLFIRNGLSRDSEESRAKGQGATENAQGCIGVYDRARESTVTYSINHQGGNVEQIIEDKSGTLTASMNSSGNNKLSVAYGFDQGATRDVGVIFLEEKSKTLANGSCPGHHNGVVICYDIGDRRSVANESIDVSPTLLSKMGTGGNNVPVVVEGLDVYNQTITGDKAKSLTSVATDSDHIPCIVMDRASYNQGENALYNIGIDENGIAFSHIAKGPGAVCCLETFHCVSNEDGTCFQGKARDYKDMHVVVYNGENITNPLNKTNPQIGDPCHTLTSDSRNYLVETKPHYIVRRLTPTECERLQGYPDGWTDIGEYTDSKGKKKKTSDSARYKALGNSIALPPWKWIIKRICSHYERDVTLASLFDGIGGFPLIWEQINGKGSCLWASEIEDFPIAVTKTRVG